jgi:hypothetical protein
MLQLLSQFAKHPYRVLIVSQSYDGGQRDPDDYPVIATFSVIVKDNSIHPLLDKDLNCENFVKYWQNSRPMRVSIMMVTYYPFAVLNQSGHVSPKCCS